MNSRWSLTIVTLIVSLGLASCAGGTKSGERGTKPGGGVVKLQGAGASFPAPLYTKWFKTYSHDHHDVQIDYQSVGSGGGVKNFIDKTVDFGASDAAMTPEEIEKVQGGAVILPMTAGTIVLSYNLEGVKELKLSRKAYAGIFLGTVKTWNDPLIVATNPGVPLPATPINVVVRADSSGTSFVFSKHLSAVSKEFAQNPGTNKMPNWPVGTRSKGNEGVTAGIKTTPDSIGYIEYGYAKSQNMPMAILENKSGNFVSPSTASGQAALASTELDKNLIGWNADPEPADAYPIATYTWMLLYTAYPDAKAEVVKDLLNYAVTEGQKEAEPLGYIPLPPEVLEKVKSAIQNIQAGPSV